MQTVYLAGPITGLGYDDAVNWREAVKTALKPAKGLSPMRSKEALVDVKEFTAGVNYGYDAMSSDHGIMTRDFYDATTCDALFVNLLGAKKVSIGTVMEIAWAYHARIPIVCAIESERNPHDHGMIREALGFRVTSLAEAVRVTRSLLAI